jgi:hypothetical protein
MEMDSSSLKKTARLAGLLYLVWVIVGVFGMFYVPAQINMRGDAASTAQNVLSHEFLFRTSIINDLITHTIWVVLVLILYRMFKQVSGRQARLLVALVIVQIPVALMMEAFNIASLMIFKGDILKTFELAQRHDLAMLLLKINDYGVLALEMFWGLWLLPLAILVYKSRFLPRFLGVWLAITGLFYMVLSVTCILLPQYKELVLHSPVALPAEIGEVAFALWLLIMGAKVKAGTAAGPGLDSRG